MDPAKLIFAVTVFASLLGAQSAGSISGHITNSLTGAGIEGVKVGASCLAGGPAGRPTRCGYIDAPAVTDTTDASGAFRLSSLPDGLYLMSVGRDGFSSLQISYNPVETVSAASGDARFDVKLTPLASLQGRVVDPEGEPVAGIAVQFAGATVITDDQGGFAFRKLDPTTSNLSAKVKPQPDGKDGERLVTTYFPSVIYAEQAVKIEVHGVDLSGYEIRLRTAPARSVSGVVRGPDGRPAAHVPVVLAKAATQGQIAMIWPVSLQRLPEADVPWDNVQTGDDGAFEFPAVLEGDWRVRASSLSYDGHFTTRRTGIAEALVEKNDVENIEIRLPEVFEVEESADWGEAPHAEIRPPQAFLLAMDGQGLTILNDPEPSAHAQRGRYLVVAGNAPPGYYASAAMLDGRDVLGQAVELSGPTTVKLVIKKDGGTLRGTVEEGGRSTVVLMAEPTAYARFGLTARCDPNGNFSIADVPPGNYTAIAFQDQGVLYLESRDLLNRIDSAHGERVKIEAGASETVVLKAN